MTVTASVSASEGSKVSSESAKEGVIVERVRPDRVEIA